MSDPMIPPAPEREALAPENREQFPIGMKPSERRAYWIGYDIAVCAALNWVARSASSTPTPGDTP